MSQVPGANKHQAFNQKSDQSDSKKDRILALLFLVAAAVLYYAYQSTPKFATNQNSQKTETSGVSTLSSNAPNSGSIASPANTSEQNRIPSSAVSKEQSADVVSRHMQKTAQQLMLEKQRVEIENGLYAPDVSARPKTERYDNKATNSDLSVEQTSLQTAKELGRASEEDPRAYSPHDVVQQELYEQAQLGEYQESYRKEYLRQYVENARRKGYEIKLDAQGRVLSVKKIRTDSGFNVLAPAAPGTNH